MDRRKKILVNSYEEATDKVLREAVANHGARVFPKVRIADALRIQSSGLSRAEYSYALRAHFDFVVADQDHSTRFAVEFDEAHHDSDPNAILHDSLKRAICEKLGMPLLRIDADYLHRIGQSSLLGWLVEVWFLGEAFYDAQESGQVPYDDAFHYANILSFGYMDQGRFVEIDSLDPAEQVRLLLEHQSEIVTTRPYDPFLPYRAFIRRCYKENKCREPIPEEIIGTDPQGYAVSIAPLHVASDRVVIGRARVRSFEFMHVSPHELALELSVVDAAKKLEQHGQGKYPGLPPSTVNQWRSQITLWNEC